MSRLFTPSLKHHLSRYHQDRKARALLALLLLLVLLLRTAGARAMDAELASLLAYGKNTTTNEAARAHLTNEGYVRSMGAAPGATLGTLAPRQGDIVAAARDFLVAHSELFGFSANTTRFELKRKTRTGPWQYLRFAQQHRSIPVFAAEVIVQVNETGGVVSVLSDIMRSADDITLEPGLNGPDAIARALANPAFLKQIGAQGATVPLSEPVLMIYSPDVIGAVGTASLAWVTVLGSASNPLVKEKVLLDAASGDVLLHYPLVHSAKNRKIYDANNTETDPGTLVRSEGQGPSGVADADDAYRFLGDTYDFYANEHGRDSIDALGVQLSATVRFCDPLECPMQNAFWDGARMYFGDGYVIDDVVAHELTHGVTQYESNLIYAYESGAINECFSDVWGEFVDLTNGSGTDTAAVRWLIGEDVAGGAIRDMHDPINSGQPDRYYSSWYWTYSLDNGGVHINSGIGNKLCCLLTDGGTFNGRTIPALGMATTAALFYEVQANLLTEGADYGDLYAQLSQATINLGLSQTQRDTLERACRAVEIGGLADAVTDLEATVVTGDPSITLTWQNPGSFSEIIVVRNKNWVPDSPTDGTVVYSGVGTSVTDGPLTVGDKYYYSVWAYHGLDEFGEPHYSPPARVRPTVGILVPVVQFTEEFDVYSVLSDTLDLFDLANTTLTIVPIVNQNHYYVCAAPATGFPTDPAGGTALDLEDDDSIRVPFTGQKQFPFYGTSYSSCYVGSNGYITFAGSDSEFLPLLEFHFAVPRISALFTDFSPNVAGTVTYKQLSDRFIVTYDEVTEWGLSNSNSFQVELYFDGKITLTYLGMDAWFGIVGLSYGDDRPFQFVEDDLNGGLSCEDDDGDGIPNSVEGSSDTDGDTIPDYLDEDSDGDGISDADEGTTDSDGDLLPDYVDDDADDDGMLDGDESDDDADGDGTPNYLDTDSDGDTISDQNEAEAPADPDGDGIPNALDLDSDGDGVGDELEVVFGSDPYSDMDTVEVPLQRWSMGALGSLLLLCGLVLLRRSGAGHRRHMA